MKDAELPQLDEHPPPAEKDTVEAVLKPPPLQATEPAVSVEPEEDTKFAY